MAGSDQMGHPERIHPADVPPGILAVHLARYSFARPLCVGRTVLDVACGNGYGAHYLAQTARQVVGVDVASDAVATGSRDYGASNLHYVVTDAGAIATRGSLFDVVCSFETIEHLTAVERYLAEVVRVLKSDGRFVVSTPCVAVSTMTPENPYHRQEWSVTDFRRLLERFFEDVTLYGQRRRESVAAQTLKRFDVLKLRARLFPLWMTRVAARAAGGRTIADVSLDDVEVAREDFAGATEIVAVASRPRTVRQ